MKTCVQIANLAILIIKVETEATKLRTEILIQGAHKIEALRWESIQAEVKALDCDGLLARMAGVNQAYITDELLNSSDVLV